jgi:hypothetical protein
MSLTSPLMDRDISPTVVVKSLLPSLTHPGSGPSIYGSEIIQAIPHDHNDPRYSTNARDIACVPPCTA